MIRKIIMKFIFYKYIFLFISSVLKNIKSKITQLINLFNNQSINFRVFFFFKKKN